MARLSVALAVVLSTEASLVDLWYWFSLLYSYSCSFDGAVIRLRGSTNEWICGLLARLKKVELFKTMLPILERTNEILVCQRNNYTTRLPLTWRPRRSRPLGMSLPCQMQSIHELCCILGLIYQHIKTRRLPLSKPPKASMFIMHRELFANDL